MSAPAFIETGQVTINSSTATEIVGSRAARSKLYLKLDPNTLIGTSSLTLDNGFLPPLDNSGVFELESADEVYAIASVGTPIVYYLETYTS